MISRRAAFVLVALVLSVARAGAQESVRPTTPRRLCFRGQAAPWCAHFVLTEIGYYRRVVGTSSRYRSGGSDVGSPYDYTDRDLGDQLTWELGAMANRGPRAASGVTLLLGVGEAGARVGLKGRYRRWMTDDGIALDVGAGLIGGSFDSERGRSEGMGLTTDVALNAADYGAVVARLDVLRAGGRTASALYGGVRLGSRPAILGTAALATGFLVLLTLISSSDY